MRGRLLETDLWGRNGWKKKIVLVGKEHYSGCREGGLTAARGGGAAGRLTQDVVINMQRGGRSTGHGLQGSTKTLVQSGTAVEAGRGRTPPEHAAGARRGRTHRIVMSARGH